MFFHVNFAHIQQFVEYLLGICFNNRIIRCHTKTGRTLEHLIDPDDKSFPLIPGHPAHAT
jgi:hypothetical protein